MVNTLKKVDFPTFGNPTIPIFKEVPNLPMIEGALIPSPPFLGGFMLVAGHDGCPSSSRRQALQAAGGGEGGERAQVWPLRPAACTMAAAAQRGRAGCQHLF